MMMSDDSGCSPVECELRRDRSPSGERRERDASRSRRELLEAALDEFSAKGFAGARVVEIAARAGLNKQLINYYFDSKEGLYRELQRLWLERKATFASPDLPLDELAACYLRDALDDPRLFRLLLWRGLSEPGEPPPDGAADRQDLSNIRRRQACGEIASDLDAGAALLAILGMVAAPIAMPDMVRKIFDLDPQSPEFVDFYARQIHRIVAHLADHNCAAANPEIRIDREESFDGFHRR